MRSPLPLFIQIHPALILPSELLSLGLLFKTCTFCSRHTKLRTSSSFCSWPSHLPIGFSEILSLFFIEAVLLIERLMSSVYELGSNSVTSVALGGHLKPLRALELFWDCDSLSFMVCRVRILGVMCLAHSRCSIPKPSWAPQYFLQT